MKRIFLLFIFFCGCGQNNSHLEHWMAADGKLKVLSTTAMIDDLVREVGEDRIDHITLIIGEIDPHSYELVKGDDEKLGYAGVIFSNGLGLEHGASLRYSLESNPKTVFLGNIIRDKNPARILIIDGQPDPHVWMDISLWADGVEAIVNALSEADPQNATFYRQNGERLKLKMLEKHRQIRDSLHEIPEEKRYLVTSHNAFNYFARAYLSESGQWESQRCAAPEGLAPDMQLSPTDIQRIIDHLCTYHIEVVFPESNVSKDSLKKIISSASQKGLNVRICHDPLYGDSMGHEASTYLDMIEHNAKVMKKAWEKEQP